jgi:purine-cytosine permease-like protein
MVVASFAIGVLGQSIFFLGFVDAILVVLFFNLLGIMTVCFFSSFGPVFGLRQMVLSRFWFGWWGVKLSKASTTIYLSCDLRLTLLLRDIL